MNTIKILLIITTLITISKIYDIVIKFKKKRLVKRILFESVEKFKLDHPYEFSEIEKLNKVYCRELIYSGHLGYIRDGGEDDRQLNIAQDKLVSSIRKELKEKVKKAKFYTYIKRCDG